MFLQNRASIHLALGEIDEARQDLRRAAAIDGGAPEYHIGLGLIEEYNGNNVNAIEEYARALLASPRVAESQFAMDLRKKSMVMWREVVKTAVVLMRYERYGQLGPIEEAKMARLDIEQCEFENARHVLMRVTELMPQLPTAWANLGRIEFLRGHVPEARRCLRRAVYLDRSYCPAKLLLADIDTSFRASGLGVTVEASCTPGIRPIVSRHARRVGQIYKIVGRVIADDALPPGFLEYCAPVRYEDTCGQSTSSGETMHPKF